MSASESSTPDGTSEPCMLASNPYAPGPATDEMDQASLSWMSITVIEDDDLMFGGKPLCTWYEEDRRRLSSSIDEEETRGRQRERVPAVGHHQQPDHAHHHQQQHGHHSKMSKSAKD